jgi:ABC-type antimicrobial peptide transport system permease subunit
MVLGHGLLLVAVGIVTGLVAAAGLMSFVPADLLPNVNGRDPLTFAATASILGFVALVATCIPAYRATRIDPLVALRAE